MARTANTTMLIRVRWQRARGAMSAAGRIQAMAEPDLVLVLRYRKAVTYGFHALLGALGEHETATRYEVRFGETPERSRRPRCPPPRR